MKIIEIELANVKIRLLLRIEKTRQYFEAFIKDVSCNEWDICIEDEDIYRYPLICPTGVLDSFSEAYLLMPRVSAYLLKYQCVLIHGVSFVWHNQSWLITAPSGTGKTTQLRHWQKLWNNEIDLINGDKSVLSLHHDGIFWLHPSPWMGKEKDFGMSSAPLGGIIVLRQAEHNEMRRISPRDSVLLIYQQFLNLADNPHEIHAIGKLESRLLHQIPVWLLENQGDEASAKLTYETLLEYEAQKNESV